MSRPDGRPTTVWSMDEVERRCRSDGACWLWEYALNDGGYPVASVNGKATNMARFVYVHLLGKVLMAKHVVTMKCRNNACLSPDCLVGATRSKIIARSYADGTRVVAAEIIRNRKRAQDRGMMKLDAQAAEAIRNRFCERTADLAIEFGVSKTTINKVKKGEAWRTMAPGASVFHWRPAA